MRIMSISSPAMEMPPRPTRKEAKPLLSPFGARSPIIGLISGLTKGPT